MTLKTLALLLAFTASTLAQTGAIPLSINRTTRNISQAFNVPSGFTLQLKSGATFTQAAGSTWNLFGSPITTLAELRTAIGAGTGTVTSFSAGDLSPLFTTSEANASTTPALTFSLSTQAANKVFAGPTTGADAAPTFRSLVADDVPDLSSVYQPLDAQLTSLGTLSYTGNAAKVVVVKATEDGFELATGGAGAGDVTAASSFGTDNRIVRSDGTGKGVQASAITLDDSGNLSGLGTINGNTIPSGTNTFAMRGANNTWTGTNTFGATTFQPGFDMINAGLGVLTLESHSTQTNSHTISLKSNSVDSVLSFNGDVTLASSFQTIGANAFILRTTGPTDITAPTSGTLATVAGTEPALGNPASNGYVLSSTTGGTRSWIAASGTGTVTNVTGTDGSGFDFTVTDGGTTPAIALAADSTHGLIKRGYANGTAVLAATPDYDGQPITATDGFFGLGTGTGAANVQGILSVDGTSTVYPVGQWQFGDNISQNSGTAQFRSLTVSTGGASITGNVSIYSGALNVNSAGALNSIVTTDAANADNVLKIQNLSADHHSTIAFSDENDPDPGTAAIGIANTTASAALAGWFNIITNPPNDDINSDARGIQLGYENNDTISYTVHPAIRINPATHETTIYGYTDNVVVGPIGVKVDGSGNVGLAPASAGTVTIGGGATASGLIFMEPSGSGTNKVTVTAPALTADRAIAWPDAAGTVVLSGGMTTSGLTIATGKLLGRTTASSGAVEEIGAGLGLTLSGGELKATSGTVIQKAVTYYNTYNNTTSTGIPADNTIPQNSEGVELFTASFTPKSASSTLIVRLAMTVSSSAAASIAGALFINSTADAFAASRVSIASASQYESLVIEGSVASPGASAQTFKVRWSTTTGTAYVNGTTSAQLYNGVMQAALTIEEVAP